MRKLILVLIAALTLSLPMAPTSLATGIVPPPAACPANNAGNTTSGPRIRLFYAHPIDQPDRFTHFQAAILKAMDYADYELANRWGGNQKYRFWCGGNGKKVTIKDVALKPYYDGYAPA